MANDGPTRKEWWRKGKPGRLKSSMVGLSAAAIVGVYAAGYVSSDADAESGVLAALPTATARTPGAVAAQAPAPTATPTATATAVVPGRGRTPSGGSAAPTATPTARASSAALAYRDGTYAGTGSGPHGGMDVQVVVESGKIVTVEITRCATRWPCTRISELPGRVVAAQSAQVAYVTRATDSSAAFVRAVSNALLQAAGT